MAHHTPLLHHQDTTPTIPEAPALMRDMNETVKTGS